jgi:hypothetical protein
MHDVSSADDLFHKTPLSSRLVLVWKENAYINAYDNNAGFACMHHFSIEPGSRKGYFNAAYIYGDQVENYSNRFELSKNSIEGEAKISDGRLTYEVLEPLKRFRITFKGKKFNSTLDYSGRFSVFDYRNCPRSDGYSPLFDLGRWALPYCHQEQALQVKGTVSMEGKKNLDIEGVANRDHSWGLRNEQVFDWYYWTGVHFDNWFSNWCFIRDKLCDPPEKSGGFLSSKDGNVPVKHIEVRETPSGLDNLNKLEEVQYAVEYVDGNTKTFVFDVKSSIGPVFFPNVPVERDVILEIRDWWGKWKVKETGEIGKGLNEMGRLRQATEKDAYAR